MKLRFAVLLAIATATAVFSVPEVGLAQRRVPMSERRGPISPYLSLFRADRGGLNTFYAFFRPQQELRYSMMQQGAEINTLQQTMQQGMQQGIQTRPATTMQQFKPAATFFNTSHYYGTQNYLGSRRR